MSKLKHWFAFLAAFCVLFIAQRAEATHFRYGNITYTIPDPVNAPRTVRFEVNVAWRAAFVDCTSLNFGDGSTNPCTTGVEIGSGVDSTGQFYKAQRYLVTHTYAQPGIYTAFFTSCCRISALTNAGDDNFRVQAKVDVLNSAINKGNPVTAMPAITQLQTGGFRTQYIPAVDPDGAPVTCRFATAAESGIPDGAPPQGNPPRVPATGVAAVVTTNANPPGCLLTWDTTGGQAGQQYAVQVVMETSINNMVTSSAVVDYIIEFVLAPPPLCQGSGAFTVDMGDAFTHTLTGINLSGGANLTMFSVGSIGATTPGPGTNAPSPFNVNFNWTPGQGEQGTSIITIVYTDQLNVSGYCSLTITVPPCPNFQTPCYDGVGECEKPGVFYCENLTELCTAVAGQPVPELCDGKDNDCDGAIDNGNPQVGLPCMTGLPGLCGTGQSTCPNGVLTCVPDIAPGSIAETCDGVDQNCDGTIDDGFNIGQLCTEGNGTCQNQGFWQCDGMGGAECSATPGVPQPEVCNGLDDDCDMSVDNGFGVGNACTAGLGVCLKNGSIVCDGMGGSKCSAVPGMPQGKEECGDAEDEDCDGLLDNGCADSDLDGIFDQIELQIGTEPNDADSDDDGVLDGQEVQPGIDSDGDGLVNGMDADSDNDGVFDGTEMGFDCSNPATNPASEACVPDENSQSTTDPLDTDTDGNGASDGSEDVNGNGAVDAGETNPANGADDNSVVDSDGDGLGDSFEVAHGSDPMDADTDDDGVLDSYEPNPSQDVDGDGLNSLLDCDSDNDALFDGTEMGLDCSNPATDVSGKHCRKDNDKGNTKTGPLNPDTDNGGVSDGAEDFTLNGAFGTGELNPNDPSDDGNNLDSDGDGLSDALENAIGSKPQDADSDDDGVIDGKEPNPTDDADGDGIFNILDSDSDEDGLYDGTEMGLGCDNKDTDPDALSCQADEDAGATTTSPLIPDTDKGGALDGAEDSNQNGVVDMNERDPNLPTDDGIEVPCPNDAACGAADSGYVCDAGTCKPGCRGAGGNGCPAMYTCTSTDMSIGACKADTSSSSSSSTSGAPPDPGEEPGCNCRAAGSTGTDSAPAIALFAAAAALAFSRRRKAA